MTAQTVSAPTAAPVAIRARSLWVGAVTTVLAIGGVLWSVLKSGTGDKSQVDSLPYVAAVALIVGAVLFAWLVPARAARHSTGLVFAIVSIPLLWAFWSALPLLVAVAAILLAATHRATGGAHRGRALAAIIIGVPVALLTLAGVLLG